MSRNHLKANRTAFRHVTISFICAAINICIMHVGTSELHLHYYWPIVATFFITIPMAYFLNREFVFRSNLPATINEFLRFISQQLAQILIGSTLVVVGVEFLQLNPMASYLFTTIFLWLFAFISQWTWVFRRDKKPPPPPHPHNK